MNVPAGHVAEKTFEVPQFTFKCEVRTHEQNLSLETERVIDVPVPCVLEEMFEHVKQSPQEECSTRVVEHVVPPQHFVSAVQDIAGLVNRGVESVNRCTHHMVCRDDGDAGGHRPTDRDEQGRHIYTRIRDVCKQAGQQVCEARRRDRRREEQENPRQRARKDDGDHGGRDEENGRWRRSLISCTTDES